MSRKSRMYEGILIRPIGTNECPSPLVAVSQLEYGPTCYYSERGMIGEKFAEIVQGKFKFRLLNLPVINLLAQWYYKE
jgi:hypothetical protein